MKTLLLTLPFGSHQTWLGHTEEGCHHSEKDGEKGMLFTKEPMDLQGTGAAAGSQIPGT